MREYWNNLRAREQRILLLGAVALTGALIFVLLVEPTLEARNQAEQRLAESRAQLNWMQEHADAVARQARADGEDRDAGSAPRPGGSLLAHVDASARAFGLADALQQVRPASGDGVDVRMEDAAFDELMGWLGELETEGGVVPVRLALERGSRGGHVNADLQLEVADSGDD